MRTSLGAHAAMLCVFASASLVLGQTSPSAAKLLGQLESGALSERVAAFDALDRDPRNWATPAATRALVKAMQRDDSLVVAVLQESHGGSAAGDKYGEGYAEYDAELEDRCFHYCDLEAYLAYVLQSIAHIPGLRYDRVGLLSVTYGDSRFTPAQRSRINAAFIAATAEPSSNMVREAGLGAVGVALRSGLASPEDRARLHRAVVRAASDPYLNVRLVAIRRLTELRDPADLPLLRRLAAEDTATALRAGTVIYPARDAARIAIAAIRSP